METNGKFDKNQIVMGLEPTGHYWVCLATWMVTNGVSVVRVNPYAVKQTNEVEDNLRLKEDTKAPKLIANLVKDGNFREDLIARGTDGIRQIWHETKLRGRGYSRTGKSYDTRQKIKLTKNVLKFHIQETSLKYQQRHPNFTNVL